MASLKLEGVTREFPGGVLAVDGVNLDVADREFLVLLGPSGCGKSTILRMIAGLEVPTAGNISINDRRVNEVAPRDRDIAMVFQNYALYPHMNVYRNMSFGLELRYRVGGMRRLWGMLNPALGREIRQRREEIDQRVRGAAEVLGISRLLDRLPGQLSGGERQRVALGRAMVRQPAAFLFDEPLSNLDAKLRVEMRRELKQLHQNLGATMIYVTHDQTEALTLGDRVVVLRQGVVQQVAPPMEVYHRPANLFVAGFLGTPAMNFLPGRLVQMPDGIGWSLSAQDGEKAPDPMLLPDQLTSRLGDVRSAVMERGVLDAVLGIRPEDIMWQDAAGANRSGEGSAPEQTPAAAWSDWCEPLPGTTTLVEPLGDVLLVHVQLHHKPGLAVISKVPPGTPLEVNRPAHLRFRWDRVHLFDPQSERAWLSPASANEPGQ